LLPAEERQAVQLRGAPGGSGREGKRSRREAEEKQKRGVFLFPPFSSFFLQLFYSGNGAEKKKKDGKREREEREGAFGHGKAAPLVFLQHIDSLALRRGPLAVLHAKDDFV
jgi:hypothetical protein